VQSRDSDVFIHREARPAVARKYPNAIFVSIHFNAARRRSAAGLEIFAIPPQGAPPTGQRQPEAHDCQHEMAMPWNRSIWFCRQLSIRLSWAGLPLLIAG
jgi:N-acetylmuramoyl-L-alanine amidase